MSQLGNLKNYPDPEYSELRLALSHFHQLPTEWILPGNGSAELLTLAGRELAQLTATCLITPAFGDYYRTLAAYSAQVWEFPVWGLGPWGKDRTDCGLIVNNPHNPTGKVLARDGILPFLEQFALVVVDEAFMDFLPPEAEQSLISLVPKYENLVVLRSLTKFYSLPGLRLGYAVAHPGRLSRWQLWRDPWPVNTLAVAAAIAAIQDQEFQQRTWKWLPPARQQLFDGLTVISGLQPMNSSVNFLLVESQQPTSLLQEKLLQQHQILIRNCLSFPELGDRFFRVAVRTDADNQRLLTALQSLLPHDD